MKQIIEFVLELEKLKGVARKVKPLGLPRYENSAEHSWQLAMMAAALSRYAAVKIDLDRVIRMLLVHDVGEIDAGDTIAFAEGGWEERKAAERAGVRRIFGMLPDSEGAGFLQLWEEFDQAKTAEAQFAHAIDRAMPVILNLANNGQSWKENGISYERVLRRVENEIRAGCPALWDHLRRRLQEAQEQGLFGA
jgi:putative hydrolases of HD superfamily